MATASDYEQSGDERQLGPSWPTLLVVALAYALLASVFWAAVTAACGQGFLHGPSGSCSGSPAVSWSFFVIPAVAIGALAAGLSRRWWPLLAGIALTLLPVMWWLVLLFWG